MTRFGFLGGVVSTLLLVAAGLFFWRGWAQRPDPVPPAPPAMLAQAEARPQPAILRDPARPRTPPQATEKTREEKRFGRADKDDDGRITRGELLEPRRKAFAKLDVNGDGRLGFEEWATKTVAKFDGADDDGTGFLTAAEYEQTKPKARVAKTRC